MQDLDKLRPQASQAAPRSGPAPARAILLVDDEVLFLSSLREGLERRFSDTKFHCAPDGQLALELLDRHAIDLVVTDLKMPRLDGFGLLARMASTYPGIPALVMTAYATDATEQRVLDTGALQCIDKPVDLGALVEKIEAIMEPATKGTLRGVSLPAFLQLLGMERLTGVVQVRWAGRNARLYMRAGNVVHAESEGESGLAVALRTVALPQVEIELRQQQHQAPRSITISLTELLLEAARQSDERGDLDAFDLDDAFAEHDARGSVLTASAPVGEPSRPPPLAMSSTELRMSSVRSMLEAAMQIDGALGVALVDCETGTALDGLGGIGELAIRDIATLNTDVVRAKLKTIGEIGINDIIEDIVITLGRQYHVIRTFAKRPSLFVYLALDRGRANLGMARYLLADMEIRVLR